MLPEKNLRALMHWARSLGETSADSSPAFSPSQRNGLLLYQRLVLERFREVLLVALPQTCERLGPGPVSEQLLRFVQQRASGSRYLRDVASEFVAYAQTSWPGSPIAPWLLELARYELLLFELPSLQPEPPLPFAPELALGSAVVFAPAARLVRFGFAVHAMPPLPQEPKASACALLVYRDEAYRARVLELSPFAAAVLEQLMDQGAALQTAIEHSCQQLAVPLGPQTLSELSELFADLAERTVLLGRALS